MRSVRELSGLVDVAVEVRDARLPRTTAVAHLHPMLARKPSIVLLNREDLAEPALTAAWLSRLRSTNHQAFSGIGTRADSLRALRAALVARHLRARLRIAIIGAPNTGKSSVINALARRKRAAARNLPGVTRHATWLRLAQGIDVLDTPGVLAPRIDRAETAWQLALCGGLPDDTIDAEEIIERLGAWLRRHRPQLAPAADLDAFARSRGMRRRGGELDRAGAAKKFVATFRAGSLFRITFEQP